MEKEPPADGELKAFRHFGPNVSHETPRAGGIPSWACLVCLPGGPLGTWLR